MPGNRRPGLQLSGSFLAIWFKSREPRNSEASNRNNYVAHENVEMPNTFIPTFH